jgi:hypothetical protein
LNWLTNTFNNRELATFIWLVIFAISTLFYKSTRKATWDVIKAVFNKKILTIIILTLSYSTAITIFLYWADFWDTSMLKQTIYWFFGFALVTLFRINDAGADKNFFGELITDNLKLIILLEFIVTIHNFNFWVELIFIPLLTLIILMNSISENKNEYKSVFRLTLFLLFLVGILLSVLSVIDILTSINDYANYETLKLFIFPIAYGVLFIPFVFIIATMIEYETLFVRFELFKLDKSGKCESTINMKLKPKVKIGLIKAILKNIKGIDSKK